MRGVAIVDPDRGRRTLGRVALALGVAACLTAACGKKVEQAAPPPPEVLVTQVVQRDVPVYTEAIGTTDGSINAEIRARVQGYLEQQAYTEGALVHAGDLLFEIDPRPYKAALDEANGQLGRALAQLSKTEQDVTRYTPLAKEGAISQQELDNAVQANRAARAQVDSARANVEQAKLNLGWTEVKSPIEGIAGIAKVNVGDLIQPSTLMTTVSQLDPIRVFFPISEQQYLKFASRIEQVAEGDRLKGRYPLELLLSDGSVFPEPGKVALANRQVDVKTGTITMVAYFPNPKNLLRPGQYAKVRAVTDVRKGALLVPQRAVLQQQGQFIVAVVGADDKVEMRQVEVGERSGQEWVVTKGLKPGERVVAEGLEKVRAGMTVNPKPFVEPTAAATPPAA